MIEYWHWNTLPRPPFPVFSATVTTILGSRPLTVTARTSTRTDATNVRRDAGSRGE